MRGHRASIPSAQALELMMWRGEGGKRFRPLEEWCGVLKPCSIILRRQVSLTDLNEKCLISRFSTKSKNQFYLALIYSLSLLVAGDGSVEKSYAMQHEVFICASVVSLEPT